MLSIKPLEKNKSDGISGFYSDHVIYGGKRLHIHLALLLSAIIKHGKAPDAMLFSVMVPIPKNTRKNLTDSDNYRAIALGNVITKLLDIIILNKYGSYLSTCDQQFGFRIGSSTTCCSYMVKETAQYYFSNGNDYVYSCLLDATKAFDRVNYCKLFQLLMDRNLPSPIIRMLIDLYTRQKMCVVWNGSKSSKFDVTNGVKQGGVLSPILFCVYVDDLLKGLKKNGVGCYVGSIYCGAFGYADDIILLSPSVNGLQNMLNYCSSYANKYDIKFNSNKSKAIVFCKQKSVSICPTLFLGGYPIDRVKSVTHLGHNLTENLGDDNHILSLVTDFNCKANSVLCNFNNISGDIKLKLFNSYCTSFYGAQLLDVSKNTINKLEISWRKAIRKAFHLPCRCHNRLIPLISCTLPLDIMLMKRIVKFYRCLFNHNNKSLDFMYRNSFKQMYSTTNANMKYIANAANFSMYDFLNGSFNIVNRLIGAWNNQVTTYERDVANIIQECKQHCEGRCALILTVQECHDLIEYLCIS